MDKPELECSIVIIKHENILLRLNERCLKDVEDSHNNNKNYEMTSIALAYIRLPNT